MKSIDEIKKSKYIQVMREGDDGSQVCNNIRRFGE